MVFVVGRSMLNVIAHARELGYIKCEEDRFQPLRNLRQYSDRDVMILTTGSQGEPMAALTRIANGSHRDIKVREGDTVVFSANPIPGNTISVVNTIDKLMMRGANVIYGKHQGIHVSGHGAQEDQKLMLTLTRPKFFLPVHGEHRMLVKHSQTAQSMGVPAENMVIINNGDVVELAQNSIGIGGKVASGIELVDSSRQGVVDRETLRDRQQLAEDGIITVAAIVNQRGKLVTPPTVDIRGISQTLDLERFQNKVSDLIGRVLRERSTKKGIERDGIQPAIESELRRLIRKELPKRYPVIVLLLNWVETADNKSPVPVLTAS
jgi:ribonuclease J